MEMLNYSLWLTFFIWIINIVGIYKESSKYINLNKDKEVWEYKPYPIDFMNELFVMVVTPAPFILLEYLIMR